MRGFDARAAAGDGSATVPEALPLPAVISVDAGGDGVETDVEVKDSDEVDALPTEEMGEGRTRLLGRGPRKRRDHHDGARPDCCTACRASCGGRGES